MLHPVVSAPSQLRRHQQRDKATSVLFVGNFAHAPNVTAALWLVETIWPLVKAQRPDLQLLIVGKNPPSDLKTDASVEILGYVDDLSELLNSVGLGVAPLLEGAGVKGKVLSALAHGLPMVTTSIGAEGIVHDERRCDAIAQADSAEAFAAEILAYFDLSQDEQQNRADIGRQFIDDYFSSSSLIQRLISMLKSFDLPYQSQTSGFIRINRAAAIAVSTTPTASATGHILWHVVKTLMQIGIILWRGHETFAHAKPKKVSLSRSMRSCAISCPVCRCILGSMNFAACFSS